MTDGPSIYETLDREKALARERRRRQGADTTLDDAERRHDAIWRLVWLRRFWGPFKYPLLLGWIGPYGASSWLWCVVAMIVAYTIASYASMIVNAVYGAFDPDAGYHFSSRLLFVFGVVLTVIGAAAHSVGGTLGGIALTLMPITWPGWSERRMARTDYSQMMAARSNPTHPRIME